MSTKQTKKAVKSAPKKPSLNLLDCEFAMVAITPKGEVFQLEINPDMLKLTAVLGNAILMEKIGSIKLSKNVPIKKTAKKVKKS